MFTHLRTHSHYSLLRALPKIKELVLMAKENGASSLALTDYSNMYGAIEFYTACNSAGIKPIIGVEVTHRLEGRSFQLTLLAETFAGYKNLMKIVSAGALADPRFPHISLNDVLLNHEGIIILSGGPWGDIHVLLEENETLALEQIKKYQNLVGEASYFLEITPHVFMDRGDELRKKTIAFAKKHNVPLVATNNCHYLKPDDKNAHRILYLIEHGAEAIDEYNALFQKGDFHFLSQEEALLLFRDIPEAVANTEKIAERCNVKLQLGSWVFPNIEFKKNYDEDVRDLAYAGLPIRGMKKTNEVVKRLEYELRVISDKGFSPYFLVVYDLLRFARENNILTNIRGSVAGSLVTYLLQITKCNPLEYKLPFERFLNPERPSAPDIDMDYADTRRDEVIDYARKKYGIDNVAQIGTFGTMMARGAVRDVARAMKFPYLVGDRISKLIPMPKQGFPVSINSALADVEDLKELYDHDREAQIILDMARRIEGCARHISVHAAGTVISPLPLWEYTPIQKDPKGGKIITQYDMYTIEEAGLLKFDFLGIRNLTILGDAIALAKNTYGKHVDIEEIPLDDPVTFSMLARGETVGLFQLNGSGMTRFLKELRPTTIFDINAMVALYRPGPIEMIPEYIKRKHDPSLVSFIDPRLEPILDQSFGVIVYQDDVMLTAIHLAGYSWLEADKLRKAMGKKIPAEMQAQKQKLLKGFVDNGLSKKKAEELWLLIEPFAAYGFNKAHAASYGRVAYQTAYMKANFPYAYMTAVLTNESGDIEKVAEIVSESKRMGIEIVPPNVNSSFGGFSIVNKNDDNTNGKEKILFGLYTIKGLGKEIGDAIIKERLSGGKYKSFEDFIERVAHKNLNRRSIEALALCGALDELAEREDVIENIDSILLFHKEHTHTSGAGQSSLFGGTNTISFTLKKGTSLPAVEKLKWEKELLGLYISGSPLDPWKEKINSRGLSIDHVLHSYPDNKIVTLGVIIETVKITKTKKGDQMALLNVRDYTGVIEVVVFPENYKKLKAHCVVDKVIILTGKISTRNNEKTMTINDIKDLVTFSK